MKKMRCLLLAGAALCTVTALANYPSIFAQAHHWVKGCNAKAMTDADSCYNVEDYAQALRCVDRHMARKDASRADSACALAYRAMIRYEIGDGPQVLEHLNQAVELCPDSASFLLSRARLYRKAKMGGKARADYKQIKKIDKTNPWPYIDQGIRDVDNGYGQSAYENFTKAIELQPLNPAGYNNRALLYGLCGMTHECTRDLVYSCSLSRNIGSARIIRMLTPDAQKVLKTKFAMVMNSDPSPNWPFYVAEMCLLEDNYDEARYYFDMSLAKDPDVELMCAVANSMRRAGSYDNAIYFFDKALKRDPKHKDAQFDKAEALCSMGKSDEGLALYTRFLKANPDNGAAYLMRGQEYFRREMLDSALTDFNRALEHVTGSLAKKNGLLQRGQTFLRLGREVEGREDLQQIIFLERNDSLTYESITPSAYSHLGNAEKTRQLCQKLLIPVPEDKDDEKRIRKMKPEERDKYLGYNLLYNVACHYAVIGDNDTAIDILARSIKAGFNDKVQLNADPDFKILRTLPRYTEIIPPLLEPQKDTKK